MTAEVILTPLITHELQKYEATGKKVKLKSIVKKRVKYSVICGIITLLGFFFPPFFLAALVYIFLMAKTNNKVAIIMDLAKKSPDKPIAQIVAEEIAL